MSFVITLLALSPDGVLLAGNGENGGIELRDTRSGRRLRTLPEPGDSAATSMAFSSDSRMLAAAESGGTAELYDVRVGAVAAALQPGGGKVNAVALSPDGTVLACGSEDGQLTFWDVRGRPTRGRLLATLQVLPCEKEAEPCRDWIAYTPEGYYDGSAGAARFIRWRIGDRLLPAAALAGRFHHPDLVRAALGGN